MNTLRSFISLVAVVGSAAVAGCGSSEPAAKTPATTRTSAPTSVATTPPVTSETHAAAPDSGSTRESTSSSIALDEAIVKACGIAAADAFFSYDSASVDAANTRVLEAVAKCFATGALRGRKIQLIGHADPRGDNDYNFSLGQRRADSVQGVLRAKSLPPAQASTTSRGAMDANGSDEAGWARDRRVDVRLVP